MEIKNLKIPEYINGITKQYTDMNNTKIELSKEILKKSRNSSLIETYNTKIFNIANSLINYHSEYNIIKLCEKMRNYLNLMKKKMTIIKPQNLSLIISNMDKLISNLPIGTYDNLVVIKSWRNKNGEQTTLLNLINNNNFSRFTILISLITNRSFYYDKKNSNNALILAVTNVVPLITKLSKNIYDNATYSSAFTYYNELFINTNNKYSDIILIIVFILFIFSNMSRFKIKMV